MWDENGTPGEELFASLRRSSCKPLLNQEQEISACVFQHLQILYATFHFALQILKRCFQAAATGNKHQCAVPGQNLPFFSHQINTQQLSQPSFNTVAASRTFVDFLADDKTDSGLHPLGRKRSRRVWVGRETVNYEAIVDAKSPTGECPFKVPSGFEAVGFFQHSWGLSGLKGA
jgi:hypothetical protein